MTGFGMRYDSQLIGAQELLSCIDDPNLRIVDCRFELADPGAGRRHYLEAHIPGAVFADLDEDLASPITPESGRHPLPDVQELTDTFGRLGIGETTDVVVYDGNSGAIAARAWWLLRWLGHDRVRLLDGGFDRWLAVDGKVRAGEEPVGIQQFVPRASFDKVVSTAELSRNRNRIAELRLIDARDVARFRGEAEPIDTVAGHVPGARNVPFQSSLKADGTWKGKAALAALWGAVLGEDTHKEWLVMCGSGVTACHLVVSALQAGYGEPRLYVGSWSEWIRDPERPVGCGKGPNSHLGPADMT